MKRSSLLRYPFIRALALRLLTPTNPEQGLTLLEAIMAMLVITVLLSFIAGPIVMTAGTRVKNQESEYGLQLAQQQIEETRIAMSQVVQWLDNGTPIDEAGTTLSMPPKGTVTTPATETISNVAAPTAICDPDDLVVSVTDTTCDATDMRAVDTDDDGEIDFYVQTFRLGDIDPNPGTVGDEIIGFDMGVRIYAPQSAGALGGLETQPMSSGMTASTLSSTRPLLASYSNFMRGEYSQAALAMNRCQVPDVVGKSTGTTSALDAVVAFIEDANDKALTAKAGLRTDDADAANHKVTGQTPPAGTWVFCGDTVTFDYTTDSSTPAYP